MKKNTKARISKEAAESFSRGYEFFYGVKPDDEFYVPEELVGLFVKEQAAKECAELYGIELESYSYDVAVFMCESDPLELIAKGKKKGWPQLSLNHIYQAFD